MRNITLPVSGDQQYLLTAREAAELLRVGRGYLYGLCREGRLKYIRFGNRFLIPRDAITEFIANETVGASP